MPPAEVLVRRRIVVAPDAFAEMVVWRLPAPLAPCTHYFKYRLAYVVRSQCVIRYDNERGKGDHRHFGDAESAYRFVDAARLMADFNADIARWNDEHSRP